MRNINERMSIIPQYAILRFQKHGAASAGSLEAHHEREKDAYAKNPDIDRERTRYNFHIIAPKASYRQEIRDRISAAGCRTRKNSVMFVDTLITASPEFFKGKSMKEIQAYFIHAVAFMAKKIGRGNIFSAVVHMDEKTPHMHLCFTPITEDGRLCASDLLGGGRAAYSRWQDEFHDHMYAKYPVFTRGESALVTHRKHIPPWQMKQSVSLDRQKEEIWQAVSGITVLNAGKKKEELLGLLENFVPGEESYLKQLRKYQWAVNYLTQENTALRKKALERPSVSNQLERARLERENEQLREDIMQIPPDIREQIQQRDREKKIPLRADRMVM